MEETKAVSVKIEIPAGWELACEHMRCPEPGDWWLDEFGCPHDCRPAQVRKRVIVRPAWVWQKWLKADWLCMASSGRWFASSGRAPKIIENHGGWWLASGCVLVSGGEFDFTPPPCDDWRMSLRRNPNRPLYCAAEKPA